MPGPQPNVGNPLFRQIADALRADIGDGSLGPGERLPSEYELVERFGTTRATIRKAIALLRSEGLVVSRQGKGAFVRQRPPVRLLATGDNYRRRRDSGTANFVAEMAAQGRKGRQHILEVAEVPAPSEVAERLALRVGSPVLVRRRLLTADDEPMQLTDGYYPLPVVADTPAAGEAPVPGGIHGCLERASAGRWKVARFVEDLDIRMPVPAEAERLSIPPGVPLARALRTAYTADEEPFEVLDSLIPCDRHSFRYVIEVP
ncbi:GntR family transcriptional regulator [Actinomycetota bacterium Odt1-20B]